VRSSYLDILSAPWALDFVRQHEKSDVSRLLLNPPPDSQGHIRLLVDQITSRRKAEKKLPNWYQHPEIVLPPPLSIEQSSSETVAHYKQQLVAGGRLVDLTGGLGVDCLTLATNFEEATYVERDPLLCELLEHNAKVLGSDVSVVNGLSEEFLASYPQEQFPSTTFYLDPARRADDNRKVVLLEDCEPDATELIPKILNMGGQALLKTSPLLDISAVLQTLSGLSEIHVVSVKNEVKEVLYLFAPGTKPDPTVTAVNLETAEPPFTFRRVEEDQSTANTALGLDSAVYLYEPNAALLKAGAFKLISERSALQTLDVHTHLYVANELVSDFPGRSFQLHGLLDKKSMTKLRGHTVHVVSRNHPLSVKEIRKRYKLKEGGVEYVIAARLGGKPIFLHAKPYP